MLDSFTELIPGHSKKAIDHYIVYKRVNQVWLCYDNELVKKANLSGNFRINLAFFRHVRTSTAVQYQIDFAVIKQGRARCSAITALGSDTDVAEKLPKLYGSKSDQKSILAKYSAIASTSTVTSETIQDASGVTPLVSQSAACDSTPSVITNPVINTGLAIASDVTPSLYAAKSKTVGTQTSVIPVVSEGGAIASTPSVIPKPSTSQVVTCSSHASNTEDLDLEQPSAIKSPSNVSDNTPSGLVITNVRSISEMSSSEVPNPSKSGECQWRIYLL